MSTEKRLLIERGPLGTLRRLFLLVKVDVEKIFRYRAILALYGALTGLALLGAYLFYLVEEAVKLTMGEGYSFAFNTILRMLDFGSVLVYVMMCILFSIEVSNQTIKCILTRPVRRTELILSKYMTALFMIALTLAIFGVIGLGAGKIFYGLGDLTENEYILFSRWYMYKNIAIMFLFLFIPSMTLASMALMFSSFSHTMGGAILTGIIGYVFFGTVAIIPNTLGFHLSGHFIPWSIFGFTSELFVPLYMVDDLPTGIPIDNWFTWDIERMLIVCGIYFAIFFVISLIVVRRRDFVL
jgi:ABC-2 type transport system permease protein